METRCAPRICINLKIISRIDEETGQKFSLAKGNVFEVQIVDISILGIGIISKYFLPKGLHIGLEIDGKCFDLENPFRIKGEVRYCSYVKAIGYRCGVKFINISSQYMDKIKNFIATYERRQEPRVTLSE
jgi:c-di-GMP-binding flagellar brake protein YcgR